MIRKTLATALLAVAATTITHGTAAAAPEIPDTVTGSHDGVDYTVTREGAEITATLTGGEFRAAEHGVDVLDTVGRVIAHIPARLPIGDHDITLTPQIEGATLIADASAEEIGYWRHTSPRQRSMEAGMGIGAAIGGITGAIIGIALGLLTMGILIPITLPIALIVGVLGGMAIGGAAGHAVPNSDVPDQWEYELECRGSEPYRYCW